MSGAAKRLLVVGIHNSPHLHRWVRMVARPDTAILVFPSLNLPYELPEGFRYIERDALSADLPAGIWFIRPEEIQGAGDRRTNLLWGYRPFTHRFLPTSLLASPQRLIAAIRAFRPHLLHSMETQMAGYVCREAARRMPRRFPPWILSSWGSDISLYRKQPGHPRRLASVLRRVRAYMPDCARDQATARQFGYRGPLLPVIPSSGGMDIDAVSSLGRIPPSRRRTIIVKGYHNWAGRSLLALSAVMLAGRDLAGYRIGILAASPVVAGWAERLKAATGTEVEVFPYVHEHLAAIERLAQARAVIGVSISDGIPTTVLEAMTVGTFPIQSTTACAGEWFENGRTGLIVPPHDTRRMADALIRVARDDALVDQAAAENLRTVRARWDLDTNGRRVWEIYDRIIAAG